MLVQGTCISIFVSQEIIAAVAEAGVRRALIETHSTACGALGYIQFQGLRFSGSSAACGASAVVASRVLQPSAACGASEASALDNVSETDSITHVC